MRVIASKIRLQYNESRQPEIILTCKNNVLEAEYTKLRQAVDNGKEIDAEIKQYRKIRSLDANSYAWVLMTKIGEAMQPPIPKEEVYIEMLKRYGQREQQLLSVVADAVDMIYRATKNHCCEVGESELKGKIFKHMAILKGSSGYNTKEMSVLIDGVVSECKELDIETLTPAELALLKEEWGKRDEDRQ